MEIGRRMTSALGGLALCVGSLGGLPVTTQAAELQVYVPGAVRPAVLKMAAIYQSETGNTISFTFGTGGGILEQIAAGTPADVTVLPSSGVAKLERQGLVAAQLEVGSLGIGVGVRRGAPRPKVRTAEELREVLLAAKSIAYADPVGGGTAGVHFSTIVLPRLGIVEQMRSKTALTAVGQDAVHRVVNGESEIVIVQASEIVAVPGADLVGLLPTDLQKDTPYAAVVLSSSKHPDAATAFVRLLVSPSGKSAFKAAGFETTP